MAHYAGLPHGMVPGALDGQGQQGPQGQGSPQSPVSASVSNVHYMASHAQALQHATSASLPNLAHPMGPHAVQRQQPSPQHSQHVLNPHQGIHLQHDHQSMHQLQQQQQQQQQPSQQQPQQQPSQQQPQQQQQQHIPQQQPHQTQQQHQQHIMMMEKQLAERVVPTNGGLFGHRLSDFHLLKTLGTGTFGRVYLCKYKDTNQYYAMKVLPKAEIVRLKQVEHINSEKNILADIDFPFVVNMICTFQDNSNIYMLLEYVIGGELFSHLRRAGKFSNDVTRFYAAEIVLAIEYLHNQNIIYRDLKPENLLLDERGHIKITDFGFAKRVLDRTWTLCGTPEYLAPEIIQSSGHGKAVDWWALGILIYEMLAGYPPFFDENPFNIYEKILANRLVFPPHFHADAKDLIKKLLNTDRSRRLGNLSGGALDVKNHKWFRGVDWNLLLTKTIRAPNVPEAKFAGDTRNFENYPEIQQTPSQDDPHGYLFTTF